MGDRGVQRGAWARPLGLFALALAFAVGQPLVVIAVTFAMLTFLAPGSRHLTMLFAAAALALAFAGGGENGLWYVERGWATIVGGSFVALSLLWPSRPFMDRGLVAVGAAVVAVGGFLVSLGGWEQVRWLVDQRVEQGVSATLQMLAIVGGGELDTALSEAVQATARIQSVLFPALFVLSSLASLGVAWAIHVRATARPEPGLSGIREFAFPNVLIWLLIAGLVLVLAAEWSAGWGMVGSNLVAFMGALYVLRGFGVLLVVGSGMGAFGGVMLVLGILLAGPVLAAGAMVVGVGDSWLDIRARAREQREQAG